MAYSDPTYKDTTRYYYYYPQCSPDVISAHGLHQHHHQPHQQPVLGVHPHDAGGGLVYHAENGGDGGAETTPQGGDGYGEAAVGAGAALRYYAKSPSAGQQGLVVDGCRPMTAPVASWTSADHGQFPGHCKEAFLSRGLCRHAVAVCLSVSFAYSADMSKHILKLFHLLVATPF